MLIYNNNSIILPLTNYMSIYGLYWLEYLHILAPTYTFEEKNMNLFDFKRVWVF